MWGMSYKISSFVAEGNGVVIGESTSVEASPKVAGRRRAHLLAKESYGSTTGSVIGQTPKATIREAGLDKGKRPIREEPLMPALLPDS